MIRCEFILQFKRSIFLTCPVDRTWQQQLSKIHEALPEISGVAVNGEGFIPQYPYPPESFYREWVKVTNGCGMQPTFMIQFIDKLLYRDHVMTHGEIVSYIKRDIDIAKRMNFLGIRMMHDLPMETIVDALPYAEQMDILLIMDIIRPATIKPEKGRNGLETADLLAIIKKKQTKHLVFNIDSTLFHDQINDIQILDPLMKEMNMDAQTAQKECERIKTVFREQSLSEFETFCKTHYPPLTKNRELFFRIFGIRCVNMPNGSVFGGDAHPEDLYDVAPYIFSVGFSFYKLIPHPGIPGLYYEPAIPYERILEILRGILFGGYLGTAVQPGMPSMNRLPYLAKPNEFDEAQKLHDFITYHERKPSDTVVI